MNVCASTGAREPYKRPHSHQKSNGHLWTANRSSVRRGAWRLSTVSILEFGASWLPVSLVQINPGYCELMIIIFAEGSIPQNPSPFSYSCIPSPSLSEGLPWSQGQDQLYINVLLILFYYFWYYNYISSFPTLPLNAPISLFLLSFKCILLSLYNVTYIRTDQLALEN